VPVIRVAAAEDLPRLTEIYNHYVAHSLATFDTEPFTDRSEWFSQYQHSSDQHPPYWLLVAEVDGSVVGYATSSPHRPKAGYRSSVETSVYLEQSAIGRGLGRALYDELLALVDGAGVHRCLAGIALPNDACVALHERCGFRRIGVFTEVGTKFDLYVDVAWYER
jgi:phosphinothricin acetyltransferase